MWIHRGRDESTCGFIAFALSIGLLGGVGAVAWADDDDDDDDVDEIIVVTAVKGAVGDGLPSLHGVNASSAGEYVDGEFVSTAELICREAKESMAAAGAIGGGGALSGWKCTHIKNKKAQGICVAAVGAMLAVCAAVDE